MFPLFKLVGEICDKEKKDPLFLYFVTNLIHELTAAMLIFLFCN